MARLRFIFCIILASIVAHSALAQNIVPNPNFILKSNCPTAVGNILACQGWNSPHAGSTDYFDSCDNFSVDIPENMFGDQNNFSQAYTGVYTYDTFAQYREYITTAIPALTIGHNYKVTIRISLADRFNRATNGMGVYFYKNAKPDSSETTSGPIPVTPQIDYTSYGVINAKHAWATLTKNFIADSAYTHLVVGCFLDDTDQLREVNDTNASWLSPAGYYYIDSVAVQDLSATGITELSGISASIYPNPMSSTTTLTFENPMQQEHTFYLYNVQGAVVRKIEHITTGVVPIYRQNLPAGFYYYRLLDRENVVYGGKMIISD